MNLPAITPKSDIIIRPVFTDTELVIPEDTTFEDWCALGESLQFMNRAIHWWIGDWIRFGERKWGEKYTQGLEETPFAYQTLANDVWVASAIEPSRRREKLPFGHHAIVAALPPEHQDELLDLAEEQGWTRSRLWQEVHGQPDNLLPQPTLYAGPAILFWDKKTSGWQFHLPPGIQVNAPSGEKLHITARTM